MATEPVNNVGLPVTDNTLLDRRRPGRKIILVWNWSPCFAGQRQMDRTCFQNRMKNPISLQLHVDWWSVGYSRSHFG